MEDEAASRLAQFMAITGAEAETAAQLLQASDQNLEEAVNLFFASGMLSAGPSTAAGSSGGISQDASEELAKRLQQEAEQEAQREENVRAADVVRTERLINEQQLQALRRKELHQNGEPQQAMDAFRDFSAEEGGDASAGQKGLAELFRPPKDLSFPGDLEAAKEAAMQQKKWLIVNIQDNSEFASHQLNRDTWSDKSVKALLEAFFVVWQAYCTSDAGQRACNMYKLSALPAVMVVDPITGACLISWIGHIPPSQLLERLEPFLDMSPEDGDSVQSALKRKHSQTQALAVGPSRTAPMTEDEEIAMAMQMSMEQADAGQQGGTAKEPIGTDRSGDLLAAAMESLPEEAEPGDSQAASVAIRLPDGRRIQRRFPKAAPVKSLKSLCIVSEQEAASGRPFKLKPAYPGAEELIDDSKTLTDAGVSGAMLVMTWAD